MYKAYVKISVNQTKLQREKKGSLRSAKAVAIIMKKTLPLFFSNAIVYGLNALYYCFIQLYISNFHSETTTGVLLAIGPFVAIFAPLWWGMIADRSKSKNAVLAVSMLGSAVCYFLIGQGQSFWYLAVMLFLTMLFMAPFGGLIDTVTLEYTTANDVKYGPIRICGTIAFGGLPMILTLFTDKNINIIFPVYVIMAVSGAVLIMLSPKVAGHGTAEKKPSLLPLFKDTNLMLIFLFVGVSQFTWAYYLNYFPAHLTSLGFSQSVWGTNVFLTALGEVPFFLMFNNLFEKFGMKRLLGLSLILCTVRYAGLALITNAPVLLLIGFITGVATTIFTYCGSYYITKNVPDESKASANQLMYALGNGVPKVLAGVLGGKMTESIGCVPSLMLCSGLCLIALIVFVFTRNRFAEGK